MLTSIELFDHDSYDEDVYKETTNFGQVSPDKYFANQSPTHEDLNLLDDKDDVLLENNDADLHASPLRFSNIDMDLSRSQESKNFNDLK